MKRCRECGISEDKAKFASHGNICKPCKAIYNKAYRESNKEKLKRWRVDYWEKQGREKRRSTVRKSNQRSPESFLRNLWHHIRKVSKYKRVHRNKAVLICEITYEYLLDLWKSQQGRCAVTGVPMDHMFNSLKTVSVDRIDSSKGYVPGNVQLVCKWVNLAKQDSNNTEFLSVLSEAFEARRANTVSLQVSEVCRCPRCGQGLDKVDQSSCKHCGGALVDEA